MYLGGASIVAILGVGAAAPALGALALPAGIAAAASAYVSLGGMAANAIAEKITSGYETKTMRERVSSKITKLRDTAFEKSKKQNSLDM